MSTMATSSSTRCSATWQRTVKDNTWKYVNVAATGERTWGQHLLRGLREKRARWGTSRGEALKHIVRAQTAYGREDEPWISKSCQKEVSTLPVGGLVIGYMDTIGTRGRIAVLSIERKGISNCFRVVGGRLASCCAYGTVAKLYRSYQSFGWRATKQG